MQPFTLLKQMSDIDPSHRDTPVPQGDNLHGIQANNQVGADYATQEAVRRPVNSDALPPVTVATGETRNIPIVRPEEFAYIAWNMFDKLDLDKNGYVSIRELAKAAQNPAFTGKEAQVLSAMCVMVDQLQTTDSGISRADVASFGEQQRKYQDILMRTNVGAIGSSPEQFKVFDKNGDGFITRSELEATENNQKLLPFERENARLMLANYQTILNQRVDKKQPEERGIGAQDLQRLFNTTPFMPDGTTFVDKANGILNAIERTWSTQTDEIGRLYADDKHPSNSIDQKAIRQGAIISDCYFESALISMAQFKPSEIPKIIKDNGNNTFTVTFPNAKDEPITVTKPTETERGLYNQGSQYGLWANVLEKAYGTYCQKYPWRRSIFNLGGGDTPTEGADGGAYRRWGEGISFLTGKDYAEVDLKDLSEAALRSTLNETVNGHPPRLTITRTVAGLDNIFESISAATADGFRTAHVFSILGFDPNGADGGTVTIRDPLQSGQTPLQMSLRKYIRNFYGLAYEKT
jgi:hypothetical protein